MDLLVIATPLSNRYRLTLWRMGGTKLWDVEVGRGVAPQERITGVAWSPNGLQIALIHDPPRLSFHSCHDGSEIRSLDIVTASEKGLDQSPNHPFKLSGVWWINNQDTQTSTTKEEFFDVFSREGMVPSSAHSILQMLLLLPHQSEDVHPMRTSHILGFGNSKAPGNGGSGTVTDSQLRPRTSSSTNGQPRHLESFPTLPKDLLAASIAPLSIPDDGKNRNEHTDSFERANAAMRAASAKAKEREKYQTDVVALADTLVLVADDRGNVYPFLEGSYPLGTIALSDQFDHNITITSVVKSPVDPVFYVRARQFLSEDAGFYTKPEAIPIRIDLLHTSWLKNVAKVSSTVRALLVYVWRTLEEMRRAWFGTDSLEGGRDVGIKWIKVLEEKEKLYDDAKKTNAVFQLTNLLFTGKTSAAMRDFLGGSGKLSERGLSQWQSTVVDALRLLRSSASKKLSPACERLVIMLEEVRGWSAWPQRFAPFGFVTAEVDDCLILCHRMIELAEWLSNEAQSETDRFLEFIKWITSESARITDSGVGDLRAPTFDPIEVSEYLESGLLDSSLDKWFLGPVPRMNPSQTRAVPSLTMKEVLDEVRAVIKDPSKPPAFVRAPMTDATSKIPSSGSLPNSQHAHVDMLDRNLVALFDELSTKCSKIFQVASGASGRDAVIESLAPLFPIDKGKHRASLDGSSLKPSADLRRTRERTVVTASSTVKGEVSYLHYIAVTMPDAPSIMSDPAPGLCLFTFENAGVRGRVEHIGAAVMDCRAMTLAGAMATEAGPQGTSAKGLIALEILDLDFFDDETLLVVARAQVSGPNTAAEAGPQPALAESAAKVFLLSVNYTAAEYRPLSIGSEGPDVEAMSQEGLAELVLEICSKGEFPYQPLPITRSRELTCCTSGRTAMLSVNGRESRRCACVLDETGQFGEIFDIDAEGDDEEEDDEAEEEIANLTTENECPTEAEEESMMLG